MRLAALIEQFEPASLASHGERLLPGARRALAAMKRCRTEDAEHLLAGCPRCHATALLAHSCGARSCPHCQHHESRLWVERHCALLLPVDYFLATFTLPQSLRPLAFAHQRHVYGAMMRCAWQCLALFAHNDRMLGVDIGATAVLHTHSRRRDYHPHVHLVVPAGGVDRQRRCWRRKDRYLFNARNLATVFRARLLAELAGLGLPIPTGLERRWIVDCRRVGRGHQALDYLGRYLYRGVLSERDIIDCRDGQVSFRYTEGRSAKTKVRTLPGAEFLWLLLQHVLPRGFRRARDYGLLHHKRKRLLARVQCLLRVALPPPAPKHRPRLCCRLCGTAMHILATRLPSPHVVGNVPDATRSVTV